MISGVDGAVLNWGQRAEDGLAPPDHSARLLTRLFLPLTLSSVVHNPFLLFYLPSSSSDYLTTARAVGPSPDLIPLHLISAQLISARAAEHEAQKQEEKQTKLERETAALDIPHVRGQTSCEPSL